MLKTWSNFEKIWLGIFTLLILAVTVIFSLNGTDYTSTKSILLNWVISPVSAITGIICVVLAARASIWTYVWGTINCITYGYLAYTSSYYGDMIINLFYFLPFQFIGFIWWQKHLKPNSKEFVVMRKLSPKQFISISLGGIIAAILFGMALFKLDNWFITAMKRNISIYNYLDNMFHIPYLGAIFDASSEVLQIIAQILMVLAYAEQWIMWILTNVITIIMWLTVIISDRSSLPWSLPTLIMWIAYLINSTYGYFNWLKGAKQNV
ncbi:MAG: nicotinamide riboside transporter PnuC [Clostridia bacterium]|nr:nicotinamide riboside transporter PnuC [Clostridia bacterium]